jgi:AraC family transcriptional regulator
VLLACAVNAMSNVNSADRRLPANKPSHLAPSGHGVIHGAVSGVNVMREGRLEPLVCTCPNLTSAAVGWSGIALESHSIQSCVMPRHEHVGNFLLVVLDGTDKCEVHTRASQLEFDAGRGTTFILPKGTVDEIRWKGPTQRITVAIGFV